MKLPFKNLRRSTIVRLCVVGIPVVAALAMPFAASAQSQSVTAPNIWPTGYWAPKGIVSCTGNYPLGAANQGQTADANGKPYCKDLTDLLQTVVNVIYLLMSIGLFIIAPILFLVGAIMMIFSGGNPGMIEKARKTMIGAVIGVVIVLCAYLIVGTVITVFHITGISGFSSGS